MSTTAYDVMITTSHYERRYEHRGDASSKRGAELIFSTTNEPQRRDGQQNRTWNESNRRLPHHDGRPTIQAPSEAPIRGRGHHGNQRQGSNLNHPDEE